MDKNNEKIISLLSGILDEVRKPEEVQSKFSDIKRQSIAKPEQNERVEISEFKSARKTKVTFYIDGNLIKQLKYLGVDLGRNSSSLAEEAIRNYVLKQKDF